MSWHNFIQFGPVVLEIWPHKFGCHQKIKFFLPQMEKLKFRKIEILAKLGKFRGKKLFRPFFEFFHFRTFVRNSKGIVVLQN